MIIQNLHKIRNVIKIKESRFAFSCLFLILFSLSTHAQDSIPMHADIDEQKLIEFQENFFQAITEKAINNPQRAIENLETCNELIPNNKSVLFELSKNYFALNRIPEAIEYVSQALKQEPENLWLLEHLVAVYKRGRDFDNAIDTQLLIAKKYPKKKRQLVYLHLLNEKPKKAITVLNELADAKLLSPRLRKIKERLDKKKPSKVVKNTTKKEIKGDLKEAFNQTNSYKTLTELLNKLDKDNNPELLTYSEKGIALYPAQPFVYLMNGKAFIKKKAYKKAVETLQNGIDFVIDDERLENRFYTQLVKAYKALGDTKNATKYQKKLK